ncbi:hypothetical protein [Ramlibacter montanisoli]|uniref:Uncharacterized protein n=1 Tax=Ramlibacter montanisoli TaxID=2732512 RepID=A0A849K3A5_9BURK|nr:hypothetical protein [Ramlibacter montanisoli]NNU42170.1 hypothetical protein [Ramlibacter montanisoli]
MGDPEFVDFDVRIEFVRGEGDPTRVFRSMAGLIEAFQRLDTHLAPMLGATVRTSLVLQDIEAASLKSRLRTVIEAIPDEPLKQGEIKKLIGHFLLQGKHKILDWCADRKEISDRNEVKVAGGRTQQACARHRPKIATGLRTHRHTFPAFGYRRGERSHGAA